MRLLKFAEAIKKYEGWYPGSRSWRNNNPGNLKYVGQEGAGKDAQGFAIFGSYEQGWNALLELIKRAARGYSMIYAPDDSILDFFLKYAPSYDKNNPQNYAEFVARECGVPVDFKIKNLLFEGEPRKFKVDFVLNRISYQDKVLKTIEKVSAFYAEAGWDMDWTIGFKTNYFDFVDFPPFKGIDWKILRALNDGSPILAFLYEAGVEKDLANFTGKFPEGAYIQMPCQEFFFNGDYGFYAIAHELCHALNWIETKDKSADTLDGQVKLVDTEEEKLLIVKRELLKLQVKKSLLEKIKGLLITLLDKIKKKE